MIDCRARCAVGMFVASMALGAVVTNVMRRRFSNDEWQTVLHDTTALLDRSWWKR